MRTTEATTRGTLHPRHAIRVISINDRNPAYINVGDTYNDLGAMITGSQSASKELSPGLLVIPSPVLD
jgi:hypothetical protein